MKNFHKSIVDAEMKSRRFIKAINVMALIFGSYCLWRINSSFTAHDSIKDKKNSESEITATHYSMPSNLIGKKLPFHRIYEARRVRYPTDLQNNSIVTNKTKVILLWTPWNGIQKTINYYALQLGNESFVKYKCPIQNCIVTRNRKHLTAADAVLFHLLDTKPADLPSYRSAQQLWIVHNMEPPWQIKKRIYPDLQYLRNAFNWTMSYRSNSDVLVRYGFIALSDKTANLVPFHEKTRNIVWFVSDCLTDSKREDYVKELNKYIDVDIYGKCGRHKCYPSQSSACYERVLQKYKFYLSFENALCKDYVTEKFFNIFNYDIVPIVFGAANYSSIAPAGTYIDATHYSDPKKLATKLHEISDSEDLYKNFLLSKRSFAAYLDPWMCRLCEMLHTSKKTPVLKDIEEWWLEEAQCKTWNKNTGFVLST